MRVDPPDEAADEPSLFDDLSTVQGDGSTSPEGPSFGSVVTAFQDVEGQSADEEEGEPPQTASTDSTALDSGQASTDSMTSVSPESSGKRDLDAAMNAFGGADEDPPDSDRDRAPNGASSAAESGRPLDDVSEISPFGDGSDPNPDDPGEFSVEGDVSSDNVEDLASAFGDEASPEEPRPEATEASNGAETGTGLGGSTDAYNDVPTVAIGEADAELPEPDDGSTTAPGYGNDDSGSGASSTDAEEPTDSEAAIARLYREFEDALDQLDGERGVDFETFSTSVRAKRERIRDEYGSGPLDMTVLTESEKPEIVIRPRQ